jgi:hypothetical protein
MTEKDKYLRVLLALEKKNQICPTFFNQNEKAFLEPS